MTRTLLLTSLLGLAAALASPTPTCQAQGLCVRSTCVINSGQCGTSCSCARTGPTTTGVCVVN